MTRSKRLPVTAQMLSVFGCFDDAAITVGPMSSNTPEPPPHPHSAGAEPPTQSQQTGDVPPPPVYSPDGKFWWDGSRWQPAAPPNMSSHQVAEGVAAGILKFILILILAPFAILLVMGLITLVVSIPFRLVGADGGAIPALVAIAIILVAVLKRDALRRWVRNRSWWRSPDQT